MTRWARWAPRLAARGALLLVLAAGLLTAAPPRAEDGVRPWSRLADPLFRHVGQSEGLPYPIALALAQDRDGFVWMGTPGGLARWDGYRMRVFRHQGDDPDSLPENIVADLMVDERGQLWAGTVSGILARYVPEREGFVQYRDKDGGGRMLGMESDGRGGIWVVGTSGAARLDTATGQWRHDAPASMGLPPGEVAAVLRDRADTLWLGTARGLMRRPVGRDRFEAVAMPPDAGPMLVTALLEDGAGALWFGTSDGRAGRVDRAGGAVRLLAPLPSSGHRITGIVEPVPGTLWFGAFGAGIVELRAATGAVRRLSHDERNPNSIGDDSVNGLLIDRSGLVWVSGLGGVDLHDPVDRGILTVLPTAANGLLGKDVRSIGVRPDGKVWLGFRGEGIALLDPLAGRVAEVGPETEPGRGLPRQMIQAIAALSNGEVWAGTRQGLYRVDPATGRTVPFLPFAGANVQSLLAEEPVLWVGGVRGLARIDLTTGATRVFAHLQDRPDSLSDDSALSLLRDRAGTLWVGTQRGLNRLDAATGTFERFLHDPDDPDSLPNDIVSTLLEDRQGRLWAGTAHGIAILTRDAGGRARFRHITSAEGLPHDTVTVLQMNPDGLVWAAGGDRLAMIDPETLEIRTFGPVDGAAVRTHWAGAGARMPDGTLLFGGIGGMTVVRPGMPPDWSFRPPVVPIEVRVDGRAVPVPSQAAPILVTPEDRSVEVDFAALDYSEPERNRYAYRLDGFDRDWVETDPAHRTAAYTGLPPGSYHLLVRGSNREGRWGTAPLSLAITVLPAWYETVWFRVGVALAGLGLASAGMRGRTALLRRRQRVLEQQVALRTAEVEAARAHAMAEEASARRAKDAAEAADRAKSRFLAIISHEIRTPLNGVLGMLQLLDPNGMDAEQRRRVDIAKASGNTLITLIESILEYGRYEAESPAIHSAPADPRRLGEAAAELFRPQATAKGIRLVLDLAPDLPGMILCDHVRITRVLHNLLGNAVKFTARGRIVLSIGFTPDQPEAGGPEAGGPATRGTLRIDVADTGIGIAPDMHAAIFEDFTQADDSIARRFGGTGLGLSVCRRIAALLGGGLTVDSAIGAGSTFHLAVPVALASEDPAVAPPPECRPLAILLVDDDPINREVGTGLLGRLGHRVTEAEDGAAAAEAARRQAFDAILMDLHMPGEDGLQTIGRIRSQPGGVRGDPVFVVMTADVTEEARQRCARAGVDLVLGKPLHLDALRTTLSSDRLRTAARDPAAPGLTDRGLAGLLDAPFLMERHELLGMADLVRLTRLFARVSLRVIGELEEAVAAADGPAARALAHRLRGSAGALGLVGLSAAAATVERTAAEGAGTAPAGALRTLRRDSLDALFALVRAERAAGRCDQAGAVTPTPRS